MREIKDVADELVVHAQAIVEFVDRESRILELAADFRLESPDDVFKFLLTDIVADGEDVETAIRFLDECAGHDQHLDLAGFLDAAHQLFLVDRLAGDEEVEERRRIREFLIQEPAGDFFLLVDFPHLYDFYKRTFLDESDRGEELEFAFRRGRFRAREARDVFVLKTDELVHEKEPHDFYQWFR